MQIPDRNRVSVGRHHFRIYPGAIYSPHPKTTHYSISKKVEIDIRRSSRFSNLLHWQRVDYYLPLPENRENFRAPINGFYRLSCWRERPRSTDLQKRLR